MHMTAEACKVRKIRHILLFFDQYVLNFERLSRQIFYAIVIPVVLLILVVLTIFCCVKQRRRLGKKKKQGSGEAEVGAEPEEEPGMFWGFVRRMVAYFESKSEEEEGIEEVGEASGPRDVDVSPGRVRKMVSNIEQAEPEERETMLASGGDDLRQEKAEEDKEVRKGGLLPYLQELKDRLFHRRRREQKKEEEGEAAEMQPLKVSKKNK